MRRAYTERVHIRETRVQAPHVTFIATYDLKIGSPRKEKESVKRNGIRENVVDGGCSGAGQGRGGGD